MTEDNQLYIRNKDQSALCSGLYLVPVPIGNLRDITLRALDVLMACDVIVCEDSRVTGKLLKAYHIKDKKKIVYNDHASDRDKDYILGLLADGKIIALVSDAGTPMISDPGYKLVVDAMDQGAYVTALPGANAVLPAIQLSGLPSDKFTFIGFLPQKDKALRDVLDTHKHRDETLICYESPKRVAKTCSILHEIYAGRSVKIIREISKLYEEAIAYDETTDLSSIKGEIVLVIEGAKDHQNYSQDDLNRMITDAMREGMSVKDLSQFIADQTGLKKKDIYNHALSLKN